MRSRLTNPNAIRSNVAARKLRREVKTEDIEKQKTETVRRV